MKCSDTKKWISPYLDSELDAGTTFEVSQHLESCPACRRRFEQETRADGLIAETLRRHEPFIDWSRLENAVLSPRRIRLWGSAGALAAAACITLVVVGIGGWPRESHANAAQWAVDELSRLSPTCEPFSVASSCKLQQLDQMAAEVLNCEFPLELDPEHLVGAVKRLCPGGKPRLEVRLNCCGKPVLLTLARPECLGELHRVGRELQGCRANCWTDSAVCNGVAYDVAAARNRDVVIVAVSPAPHPLKHLLALKR